MTPCPGDSTVSFSFSLASGLYARLHLLAEAIPGLHRLLVGAPVRAARRSLGIG